MSSEIECLCCQKGLPKTQPRVCPICDHIFKGNGWDGIDAHWKAHHLDIMPYSDFWDSLCEGHGGDAATTRDESLLEKHAALLKALKVSKELFLPRVQSSKHKTIADGYYFIGADHYLETTFWTGRNKKAKIYNIAFVILADGTGYIELAGETDEKREYLNQLQDSIGGFTVPPNRKKWWRKYFEGNDYISNLEGFLDELKLKIDEFIQANPNEYFRPLENDDCQKHINKVVAAWSRNETQYMTRICWNDNDWKYPSGRSGKSSNPGFESDNGYGHEEWLFDRDKVVDGYHYGFLEALHKGDTHTGKTYNLRLFSIHSGHNGRKNYYVGEIESVECVSFEQSLAAYQVYKEHGWLQEMRDQVRAVGGNADALDSFCTPEQFFNIRFKFNSVRLPSDLWELSKIPNHRYSMYKSPGDLGFVATEGDGTRLYDTNKTKVPFRKGYERDPRHSKILNALQKVIKTDDVYAGAKVYPEQSYVDMRAVLPDHSQHFFEIKTATPLRCIREALGQIMEYSYFPTADKASRLIVVGEDLPNEETQSYLEHIRERFSIPIYYRSLDIEQQELSDEY